MPSTHTCLIYHVIFATKNREPLISREWRTRLHEYLGGVLCNLGGSPKSIGGVADHVHLLFGLASTHSLADVMRDVKSSSSVWVAKSLGLKCFRWQQGYAAFTVSASACSAVKRYVETQEVHHRVRSLKEELSLFLEKSEIEWRPEDLP